MQQVRLCVEISEMCATSEGLHGMSEDVCVTSECLRGMSEDVCAISECVWNE